MKLMLLIFCTTFFAIILANEAPTKSLWDQIVQMKQIFLSVEYNGRRLNVWREDVHGYSRFFVTPLCVLDTSSAKCILDEYSKENPNVFSFYVQLWDSDAAGIVQLALKAKGIVVEASDIIPLPMQMVRLSVNRHETKEITVDGKWRSYQGQPNGILFDLWVESKHFCDRMVKNVKSDPETFLDRTKLHFEYTMFVGQQAFQTINITGNTIMKSDFFAKLVNEASKDGTIYLQSDDVNKLARDIYRNTVFYAQQTDDYISSKNENQIIFELFNQIKGDQILLSQLTIDDRKSVFWNDDFSRPNMQTTYLNDIFSLNADKQRFKYDEVKDLQFMGELEKRYGKETIKSKQAQGGFMYGLFGGSLGGQTESQNSENEEFFNKTQTRNFTSISKDELQNYLDINKATVKWTGEKFEPKELELQRLNTNSMRAVDEIFYKRVVTTKLAITQELPLQVEPKFMTNYSNSASPIFYEALEKANNKTNAELDKFIMETNAKIYKGFTPALTELQNAKTVMESQMKAQYHEIIAKIEEKNNHLSAELNGIRSTANENKGVIGNNFNHHENRLNQHWGEIEELKRKIRIIKKDLGYSCWMSSKCHADRLETASWGD